MICYVINTILMKRLFAAISILLVTVLLVACTEFVEQGDVEHDGVSYADDEMAVSVAPTLTEDEQYWDARLAECEALADVECDIETYLEKYQTGDTEAGFKVVYYYRIQRDYDAAYAMLDEIGEDYPDLMGRVVLKKGGIAMNQYEGTEEALGFYLLAANEYGDLLLGDNPVGITALDQAAGYSDPETAGQLYRRIIYEYADHLNNVLSYLEEAILQESTGMSSGGYAYDGACGVTEWRHCLFENGEVTGSNEVPEGFVSLAAYDPDNALFWFKLSEEDQAIYDKYK